MDEKDRLSKLWKTTTNGGHLPSHFVVQETATLSCVCKTTVRYNSVIFFKVNDTEPALAADAYLTFIAIIIRCESSLLTHTCTHITPPYMRSITVFQQTIGAFLTFPKKQKKILPRKTVTDPDPGPSVSSFTKKWKRSEGQCFRNSVHRCWGH